MENLEQYTSNWFANELHEGDICYAVVNEPYVTISNGKYWMSACQIVEIIDPFHITVDFLTPRKELHVFSQYHNGIKAEEFSQYQEDWHKLPKGWTYNTTLFSVVDICRDNINKKKQEAVNWQDLDSLKKALEDRVWCKVKDNFSGKFEADIDKHKGWILRVKYDTPSLEFTKATRVVPFNRIYKDFASASKCCRALKTADLSTANMTEKDYAIAELNRTLRLLQLRGNYSFEDIDKFRQNILSLDDKVLETLETKLGGSGTWLEYRVNGKKRWISLRFSDLS